MALNNNLEPFRTYFVISVKLYTFLCFKCIFSFLDFQKKTSIIILLKTSILLNLRMPHRFNKCFF